MFKEPLYRDDVGPYEAVLNRGFRVIYAGFAFFLLFKDQRAVMFQLSGW